MEKNISPSTLADEIGVARSSISHILTGRNKPSLDIVQKIILRYPELGTNWIMGEKDTFTTKGAEVQKPVKELVRTRVLLDKEAKIQKIRTVDRVLIFYTDGTFNEYKPDNN